jgi:serine palmitoyltransferase
LTGESIHALNLASYNYLGFADPQGKHIDEVIESLKKYGVSTSSPALELGLYQRSSSLSLFFLCKCNKKK